MRRRGQAVIWIVTAVCCLVATGTARAERYRYRLEAGAEVATLSGGTGAHFYLRPAWQAAFSYELAPRWTLDLGASGYTLYNDSTLSSSFTFSGKKANADLQFDATRLGATFSYVLAEPTDWFRLHGGIGGGLMIWELRDPVADTVVKTTGTHNESVEFQSTELFVSAATDFEFRIAGRWSLNWRTHVDYLTGAGTDFADPVNADRNRFLIGSGVTLGVSFGIGGGTPQSGWASEGQWSSTPTRRQEVPVSGLDSDGDGVPDSKDDCPDTPVGAVVDSHGCALDSDGDGIVDGRDDCPGTDVKARGKVDIYGCPIDSDFDGVPDYLDNCPNNPVGAVVDATGCPLDGDGDGVPDGLDDCPNTLPGVAVDRYGCMDLEMFSKPMVLNIDYAPGSFEIDPNTRERLRKLARLLLVVPEINLEINGYTDNIGTEPANQALSEKRANRVRDFLVSQGVDTARIKVFGRGETNFVASNDTAEGRAQNRRIEIIFYK